MISPRLYSSRTTTKSQESRRRNSNKQKKLYTLKMNSISKAFKRTVAVTRSSRQPQQFFAVTRFQPQRSSLSMYPSVRRYAAAGADLSQEFDRIGDDNMANKSGRKGRSSGNGTAMVWATGLAMMAGAWYMWKNQKEETEK